MPFGCGTRGALSAVGVAGIVGREGARRPDGAAMVAFPVRSRMRATFVEEHDGFAGIVMACHNSSDLDRHAQVPSGSGAALHIAGFEKAQRLAEGSSAEPGPAVFGRRNADV